MEAIGGRVEYLVDHVVARSDEAGRKDADQNIDPQPTGHVGWVTSDRGNDPWQDEDILEPVIDAHDLDVTANRGARGHLRELLLERSCADADDRGCHALMLDGRWSSACSADVEP